MATNFLNYFTEQDLIDRYVGRRKSIPREDVEDLYKALVKFVLFKLEDEKSSKMGFHLTGFCSFLHKRLKIDNLRKSHTSPQYKRAEEQLHHWLSGHQRLKIEN
jgi:hypothetical protein